MAATIRKAEEGDLARLIEILRATYETTMAPVVPPEALQAFRELNGAGEFARRCWQDFDVAVCAGTVAGLLFVVGNRVESLHIHPDHARRGLGKALLDHAETRIGQSFPVAELDVLEGNLNALAFYEARSWQRVKSFMGLEVGDVPAPMILMRKTLIR